MKTQDSGNLSIDEQCRMITFEWPMLADEGALEALTRGGCILLATVASHGVPEKIRDYVCSLAPAVEKLAARGRQTLENLGRAN